jgi:hypothetical protein
LNLPNRNDQYPGPGSYISFSEFGILDPNYKKRMQTEPDKNKEAEGTKNEENQDHEEFHEEIKVEVKKEKIKEPESKKEEIKHEEAKNEDKVEQENPKVKEEDDEKDDTALLKEPLQY